MQKGEQYKYNIEPRIYFVYESRRAIIRDKESAMNTDIGHLESIMEQQQEQQNTNKTKRKKHHRCWVQRHENSNGVALIVVVLPTLRIF